ncbi:MAG: chemotaxis protein CheW [Gammaproteobacteria bacterium]|nr:chemotaxis protein CheW [Gammaproteobacteria bacterium]
MAEQESIRCIQLPLVDWQLILPNSTVAEIIAYSKPEQPGEDWYDGLLSWRGVMVPVVSIEGMCQRNQQEPGHRSRTAIIYNLSGDKKLPYIGVILQDIPRAYLAEEDRMQSVAASPECEFLIGRADIMLEQLMIPDLDAIMAAVKQRLHL